MRMEYNETYNERVHKYTVNIPVSLYKEAEIKSRAAGFEELAPYIRAIISQEVRHGNMNLRDILNDKEVTKREIETKYRREYPSNTKYSFIKIKVRNMLDKLNPRQYTLFK